MTKREKCKHCDRLDCDVHCPETKDGHHQIDPSSIRPGDGHAGPSDDGGPVAISVACLACGTCGDAELSPTAVAWDDP